MFFFSRSFLIKSTKKDGTNILAPTAALIFLIFILLIFVFLHLSFSETYLKVGFVAPSHTEKIYVPEDSYLYESKIALGKYYQKGEVLAVLNVTGSRDDLASETTNQQSENSYFLNLLAPYSGVVTQFSHEGALYGKVLKGTCLAFYAADSSFVIKVPVDKHWYERIHQGQNVLATDSLGNTFKGKVNDVIITLNENNNENENHYNKTAIVTIDGTEDFDIDIGSHMKVRIITDKHSLLDLVKFAYFTKSNS